MELSQRGIGIDPPIAFGLSAKVIKRYNFEREEWIKNKIKVMAYDYPKITQNADGTFGPTTVGHHYTPIGYHNRVAMHRDEKNKWCLKRNEQYEVFRLADEGNWLDGDPDGLYSIVDNGREILGKNGERIAFFPKPQNENDAWHGYPKSNPPISDGLIERWHDENVIDGIVYKRLMGHRL